MWGCADEKKVPWHFFYYASASRAKHRLAVPRTRAQHICTRTRPGEAGLQHNQRERLHLDHARVGRWLYGVGWAADQTVCTIYLTNTQDPAQLLSRMCCWPLNPTQNKSRKL